MLISTVWQDYRHPRTGKGKQKKKPIYDDESSLHFQTPAWYNNSHLLTDTNEDQGELRDTFVTNKSGRNPRNSRGYSSQNETTSLLNNSTNYSLTSPPSHYISRSILDKQNQLSSQPNISNSVANSLSRNDSLNAVKFTGSMSSLN